MNNYYQSKKVLGGAVEILLVSNDPKSVIEPIFKELWQETFQFERRFSRFIPASELSVFNRGAGRRQPVSDEFRELLMVAKKVSAESGGLYNPFILPALQKAGYKQSMMPGYEGDRQEDYSKRHVVGCDRLEVSGNIAFIPKGTALDLGGIGKGYLAEKLGKKVEPLLEGYWLSLGGDIAIGGVSAQDQPWTVGIQSAGNYLDNIAQIDIPKGRSRGVATSGVIERRGANNGGSWHHIIDTRTLRPAKTDILTATVVHRSPLMADILASGAVVLGSEKGLKFLKANKAEAAFLQCRGKTGEPFMLSFGASIRKLKQLARAG